MLVRNTHTAGVAHHVGAAASQLQQVEHDLIQHRSLCPEQQACEGHAVLIWCVRRCVGARFGALHQRCGQWHGHPCRRLRGRWRRCIGHKPGDVTQRATAVLCQVRAIQHEVHGGLAGLERLIAEGALQGGVILPLGCTTQKQAPIPSYLVIHLSTYHLKQ